MTLSAIAAGLVLVVILAAHSALGATATAERARLGVVFTVSRSSTPSAYSRDFWERLRELGWTKGQNLLVEERWAEGRIDRMPQLIDEVLRLKVDVILTFTEAGAIAARKATQTTPIVVAFMGDPVGAGVVESLSRPGANLTGLSVQAEGSAGKCLELLKEVVPRLSRVAVLWNPDEPFYRRNLGRMQADAASLGLKASFVEIRTDRDLEPAFERARVQTQAVLVLSDPFTYTHQARIVSLAARARLPAASNRSEFAADGGLITYGVNVRAQYKRAAEYIDKILRGTKAGDIPIEQPTQFDLVINLKTAKALRLSIPEATLSRADQVIR
jgi:putative ABC transport system substrate-binding protein